MSESITDDACEPMPSAPRNYYAHVRREICDLIPTGLNNLLDVGCGEGATGAFLRDEGYCKWVCGLEMHPAAAEIARQRLDQLIEGNVDTLNIPFGARSIDIILCLDILEHLPDPWRTLRRVSEFLAPGGVLIASVPNVRNLKVLIPLIFLGRWEYADEGILDRTHLRFFTRFSAIGLARSAGLRVRHVKPTFGRYARVLNAATLGLFQQFLATQYIVSADWPDTAK